MTKNIESSRDREEEKNEDVKKIRTNTVTGYDMGSAVCEETGREEESFDSLESAVNGSEGKDFFWAGFHCKGGKVYHDGWHTLDEARKLNRFADREEEINAIEAARAKRAGEK